jgi:hypothetical protein
MRRVQRIVRLLIIVGSWVAAIATPVGAQQNDPSVSEDNIHLMEGGQPVLEYAIAGAFLLAAMAIGFRPCKRSQEKKSAS